LPNGNTETSSIGVPSGSLNIMTCQLTHAGS
jgi:hypothetical protein